MAMSRDTCTDSPNKERWEDLSCSTLASESLPGVPSALPALPQHFLHCLVSDSHCNERWRGV